MYCTVSPLATLLRTAAARQVVLPVPGGPWITDTGGQLRTNQR